jgi:DNA-binding response OmpR family regulator
MSTKILIVEDDPHILLGLEEVFKSEGYETSSCNRGDEALAAIAKFQPALIVLDVMLPGASGYELCKALRTKKVYTPVLMLTAKGQEIDKVVGLDLGADDYVTKPFGVRELLARIQALLRRSHASGSDGPRPAPAEKVFRIGEATVDPRTFQLKRGRTTEELTAKELKLLQVFHTHAGEVLSPRTIFGTPSPRSIPARSKAARRPDALPTSSPSSALRWNNSPCSRPSPTP